MNISPENLLAINNNLELTASKDEILKSEISNLKVKHGIDSQQSLQSALDDVLNQERLLNIGIVGRVKAGKSSLLNALFFDGESVLPNAATPMTAALTTLTYGDNFGANVEFYSEEDIHNIKEKANEYERRLKKEVDTLTEKQQSKHGNIDEDMKAKIQRMADSNMKKEVVLNAAYDQFQRMKQSGMLNNLPENNNVRANDIKTLSESLLDYVGATGKFMPFTKSVNITLPLERLKDIQVIDTPGFNDPVQSREARTVELLKSCDAIFIVSPSGQFLSAQDLEMMGRITKKEGVQEIVVVASQIDMQFFGSEKRDTVNETLQTITGNLSRHMADTLKAFKQDSPEIGNIFDNLIQNSLEHLYYSSGICYAIAQKLQNNQSLNENEQHVWLNLIQNFPDYFSQNDITLSVNTLNTIANLTKLNQVIDKVRSEKDRIKQERISKLINAKYQGLQNYKKELLEAIDEKSASIKNADIQNIEAQIKHNTIKRDEVERQVTSAYMRLREDFRSNVDRKMLSVISEKYHSVTNSLSANTSETTESRTVEKKGLGSWFARKLWGGGTQTITEHFTKVQTAPIADEAQTFLSVITRELSSVSDKNAREFKDNLYEKVITVYRNAIDDDTLFNEPLVKTVTQTLVNKLPSIPFEKSIQVPSKYRKGTLKGDEAEDYIRDIDAYISQQKRKFETQVEDYIEKFDEKMPKDESMAEQFTKDFDQKIEAFKKQVSDRGGHLGTLETFRKSIEKVTV